MCLVGIAGLHDVSQSLFQSNKFVCLVLLTIMSCMMFQKVYFTQHMASLLEQQQSTCKYPECFAEFLLLDIC